MAGYSNDSPEPREAGLPPKYTPAGLHEVRCCCIIGFDLGGKVALPAGDRTLTHGNAMLSSFPPACASPTHIRAGDADADTDTDTNIATPSTYNSPSPRPSFRSRSSYFNSPRQKSKCQHTYQNSKRDSKISIIASSIGSSRSHREYLDSLNCPTPRTMERINTVQEQREQINSMKRAENREGDELSSEERAKAVALIQRHYRGHRERRMLEGLSLDPSSRWSEVIKEARYKDLTQPRPRVETGIVEDGSQADSASDISKNISTARQNWKKIGLITRRAGGDEDSDYETEETEGLTEQELEEKRQRKAEARKKRMAAAKLMELQYFLEIVDVKHRYGLNLRIYHEQWKASDTKENFFYWLDYGEGRSLECAGCTRETLDRERIRYLSKEERWHYLVKIDKEGKFCWAKNGAYIDTTEKYKDSIHGIVPDTDNTPAYVPTLEEAAIGLQAEHEFRTSSSQESTDNENDSTHGRKYVATGIEKSTGVKKVKHVSVATMLDKLLRGAVQKNTWIFVADTSFRLYVGIKKSGAFQHSSFLHGSRVCAAGLIKIENGRLVKLSPLSGHYRPPASNFKAFVASMKGEGADMSHLSISRAYAVLVGLETYIKTRDKGKSFVKGLVHHKGKEPEVAPKRKEEPNKKENAAKG